MKVVLKNIKVSEKLSEETTCFSADVFVNGKKVAYARNSGRGGCTDYNSYENKREVLRDLEQYLSIQPNIVYSSPNEKSFEMESNLENLIDFLLDEHLQKKEDARMKKVIEKACLKSIVFGIPNSGKYRQIGYNVAFEILAKRPNYEDLVKTMIDKVKSEMVDGEIIYNTNINLEKFTL